ncbi:YkgJ family cysteine cluster protein [Halarcobacter ebronensis]|uniref:Zinc/iron-chelating domain-containing protein n=1 Tax=Halarcobacter ebronensis TaxID=1462615 RepID=A0A4Q1AMC9_9BACT|nr:YkgJ family cysteine cluster protein [Halarcobacter ebronensis]QKF81145.1 YkgJ family cysteine cluster protein [Halarcobacter ebronensis]RXK03280.1 zinc/iron-chelating domain-containing protein [Halarcobacter ebronensis]
MFIAVKKQTFYFGDCKNCEAKCCSGKDGIVFSQILLEDFEKVYKNFPIVFIFGNLGYIKPVILLTNGKDYCPYLKDFKCTIYENRPPVCRNYPLSGNLDNKIYIDINCPEVNTNYSKEKKLIVRNEKLTPVFYNDLYFTYQDRYIQTHEEFEKLNKNNFQEMITINNIKFFKYIGAINNNFLEYHKLSLKNFDNFL